MNINILSMQDKQENHYYRLNIYFRLKICLYGSQSSEIKIFKLIHYITIYYNLIINYKLIIININSAKIKILLQKFLMKNSNFSLEYY